MFKPNSIVVKTASEISLKSTFVRANWVNLLKSQILGAAKNSGIKIDEIKKKAGYFVIYSPELENLLKLLSTIFGIASFSLAQENNFGSIEQLTENAYENYKEELELSKTYRSKVRRVGNHNFSSKDVEVAIAEFILPKLKNLKLNLDFPEKTIEIEIRDDKYYFLGKKTEGLAGLPIESQGNVGLFFKGTKEDLLAGLLFMKRGCKVFPIIDDDNEKIKNSLKKLSKFNLFNEFQLISKNNLQNATKEFNLILLVDSNTSLKANYDNSIPIFFPLQAYPQQLLKQKQELLA